MSDWDPGEHGRGVAYDREIKRRMAGGKKPKVDMIVTGFDECDQALAEFDKQIKKSIIRKATREAMKQDVLPEYQRIVASEGDMETGAMRDVAKVGVAKVKRGSGKIGNSVFIDRNLLIQVRSAKGGRIGYDKKRNEAFYYFAAEEYGTPRRQPKAPLRRALAASRQNVIDRVRKAIVRLVDELSVGKRRKTSARTADKQVLTAAGVK